MSCVLQIVTAVARPRHFQLDSSTQLNRVLWNPLIFVTGSLDIPRLFRTLLVRHRLSREGPVGIGPMSLAEDRLRLCHQLGMSSGDIHRLAGIVLEVIDLNGFVNSVANSLPVTKASRLNRLGQMQLPVEIV